MLRIEIQTLEKDRFQVGCQRGRVGESVVHVDVEEAKPEVGDLHSFCGVDVRLVGSDHTHEHNGLVQAGVVTQVREQRGRHQTWSAMEVYPGARMPVWRVLAQTVYEGFHRQTFSFNPMTHESPTLPPCGEDRKSNKSDDQWEPTTSGDLEDVGRGECEVDYQQRRKDHCGLQW